MDYITNLLNHNDRYLLMLNLFYTLKSSRRIYKGQVECRLKYKIWLERDFLQFFVSLIQAKSLEQFLLTNYLYIYV